MCHCLITELIGDEGHVEKKEVELQRGKTPGTSETFLKSTHVDSLSERFHIRKSPCPTNPGLVEQYSHAWQFFCHKSRFWAPTEPTEILGMGNWAEWMKKKKKGRQKGKKMKRMDKHEAKE